MSCASSLATALTVLLSCGETQTVRLERNGPYLTAASVYVNGAGPHRFFVDTGAQSSVVSPPLAAKLNLQPVARVRQITAAGESVVGVARANTLALQPTTGQWAARTNVEILIGGLEGVLAVDHRLEGILGHNFFEGRNYLLDYAAGKLTFDPDSAGFHGQRVPFRLLDGRIVIQAKVAGRERSLVLDSGASTLVLFDSPHPAGHSNGLLSTNSGQISGRLSDQRVEIGECLSKRLPSITIAGENREEAIDGLLPASAFRSIYVNGERGYVVFDPRR